VPKTYKTKAKLKKKVYKVIKIMAAHDCLGILDCEGVNIGILDGWGQHYTGNSCN